MACDGVAPGITTEQRHLAFDATTAHASEGAPMIARVNANELLKRAWEAVKQSGIPESLYETAFREAVEELRAMDGGGSSAGTRSPGTPRGGRGKPASRPRATAPAATDEETATSVDENAFFATLAHESGVAETNLRDVLSLSGSNVHVTPATRVLGASKAQQARTTIALVAGARAFGLGERPIDAEAVRAEVKRKHAYDEANYAAKHELRGQTPGRAQGFQQRREFG